MSLIKDKLEEVIRKSPLTLLALRNEDSLKIIQEFLPYSVGIEIECTRKDSYNIEVFKSIPNIMSVQGDSHEERFRIPHGIKGLLCLYCISEQLKNNNLLNLGSGIHYHIDMTDSFDLINQTFLYRHKDYILSELDKWSYVGTYNIRDITLDFGAKWVKFQNCFKTAEIRIGEMTFDYEVLVDRIIDACRIIKTLKVDLLGEEKVESNFNNTLDLDINFDEINEYIKNNVVTLSENQILDKIKGLSTLIIDPPQPKIDVEEYVLNRTIKRF